MKKQSEKVKIYEDKQGYSELISAVEFVRDSANEVITVFEDTQPYVRIETREQAETLLSDPIGTIDKVIQENSGIKVEMVGSRSKIPPASKIAELYDLPYSDFIAVIKGERVDTSCKVCSGAPRTIKTGNGAVKYATYLKYREYLSFEDNGRFGIAEEKVAAAREQFDHYIEDPKQISVWNFWHDFERMLNEAGRKGYLSNLSKIQEMSSGRLLYTPHIDQLVIDETALRHEVERVKQ